MRKFEDLVSYLARATVVGQEVKLDILRDGKEQQITAKLEARPAAEKTAVRKIQPSKEMLVGCWPSEFDIGNRQRYELDND